MLHRTKSGQQLDGLCELAGRFVSIIPVAAAINRRRTIMYSIIIAISLCIVYGSRYVAWHILKKRIDVD